MASRIKGITVEIGGDTTGLDKALKGTNNEIKSTQSQLKDVERLLKLDPTNTELLKQKQQLLAKAVSETKDKLQTLKTAESQAQQQFKEGKISQDQYNALKREIISTEESLKNLKKEAADSNATIQKIGTTAGNVAEKTRGLSLAAAGALTTVGAAAVKAGKSADDLNTLSKQTGITTAELQKMQYASEIVDVSVDTITGSMRKMKKNMDSNSADVQAAWQAIGVSTTDASGKMKPATDIFYETIGALSKVGNETERDQLAMLIFGKSADELAGVIDDGGTALKQLGLEAENAGLIMSQDAIDGANEFNDAVDKLKATAAASFGKIAGQLAQTLIPLMEKVSKAISEILNWMSNLSPETQKIILIIFAVIAAISPIAKIIQGITVVQAALNAVLTANPIGIIIVSVAALIALLVVLYAKCEGFRNFVKGMIDFFKEYFKDLGSNIWDYISAPFKNIIEVVKTVVDGIKQILDGDLKGGILTIGKGIVNGLIGILNGFIKGLNLILTPVRAIIVGIGKVLGKGWSFADIKVPEIPKLAKGGIVSNGSAIFNEAGPELLTVSGGKAQVTPLSGSQAQSALSSITNNYGARQLVNVFEVGGQTVAKVIQPSISQGLSNSQFGRRRAGYAH